MTEKQKLQPGSGEGASIDPMNLIFARVMEIATYLGMIFMLIFGIAYLSGFHALISPTDVVSHWHMEADKFWTILNGQPVKGYYFFHSFHMDCLTLVGISILSIAPLISLMFSFVKAEKTYKIFFLLVILIFIFAVLKPIFFSGLGAGH